MSGVEKTRKIIKTERSVTEKNIYRLRAVYVGGGVAAAGRAASRDVRNNEACACACADYREFS